MLEIPKSEPPVQHPQEGVAQLLMVWEKRGEEQKGIPFCHHLSRGAIDYFLTVQCSIQSLPLFLLAGCVGRVREKKGRGGGGIFQENLVLGSAFLLPGIKVV